MEPSKLKDVGETAPTDKMEIGILASAKRMGLTFEELNLFSLNDYLDFVDKFTDTENEESSVRIANQRDIDTMLG